MDSRQYPESFDLQVKNSRNISKKSERFHKLIVEPKQFIKIMLDIPWSSVCNEKSVFLVKPIETSLNMESETGIHS